jgi:peptidyl-prolyl cis-trans isomerase SurA
MSGRRTMRSGTTRRRMCAWALAVCAAGVGGQWSGAQTAQPEAQGQVLDRVVAVVNNHAILSSDLDEDIRLAIFDPNGGQAAMPSRQRVLEQLISRTLIQQQIREEDEQTIEPSQADVSARIEQIRKELPVCVRANCVSDAGWAKFLAAHGLTADEVQTYMRNRMETLNFIEERFRQGIRIAPQEIEDYYKNTLLPQYPEGQKTPSLKDVSPRIEEILLQQQVNALFDDWLKNLREQGDIEVLDPALAAAETQAGGGGGSK